MRRLLSRFLSRDDVVVAVKAGVACGLAFYLGSLLPAPVDDYKYYAALGAFTVVGLVVVDSLKESLRVFGAVVIGVVVALLVQSISWTNFLTVGVAVLVGSLLMALPLLGDQRTWAPLAALFVLAAGGPDPEPMVLGYLFQLPLGALVGVVVNLLVLPPLGSTELHGATTRVHQLMVEQMRSYADLLGRVDGDDPPDAVERDELVRANESDMAHARARLSEEVERAARARRGNPRAWAVRRAEQDALDRARATERCAATLLAVGVVIGQSAPGPQEEEGQTRRSAVRVLRTAADIFEDPGLLRTDPALVDQVQDAVEDTLRRARSPHAGDGPDGLLLGALALTVRDSVEVFTSRVAVIDPDPDPA
ncbi:hypothetical protein [Ornithinimicrobium avium]|uniref:FUSC family protein n=1 Tax=Ornithinimicrobium avium TaxID=2283195 RepID=A0A345NJW3_9MICO|nr:hypothetical protein [Ornithinimicrobium avium]AXH95321.1 hypothetical protein DV701_03475 [Ornithinimicrobium avium]